MTRLPSGAETGGRVDARLTLRYDQRGKSRSRVRLDDGNEAGLFLERGTVLADGDLLGDEGGRVVRVVAAAETVSSARAEEPLLLARACYHLGNRHIALQIEPQRLRYLHDHVLDELLRGLGLEVTVEQAPFEPEAGAYGGGHAHARGHGVAVHGSRFTVHG